MTRLVRHLLTAPDTATTQVSSDFLIIMAALFCLLICFLGVLAVARCTCFSNTRSSQHQQPPVIKGLKKKALKSLPIQSYTSEFVYVECAICLAEFANGDVIRVLPPCGHGFHVDCIDTWLGSNSSCPSCRHILDVGKCKKCGGVPSVTAMRVDVEAPTTVAEYLP